MGGLLIPRVAHGGVLSAWAFVTWLALTAPFFALSAAKPPVGIQGRQYFFIEDQASIHKPGGVRLHYAEIGERRFARGFSLSAAFDISKIEANLDDGILKQSSPRREEVQPRRIEI